MADTPTPDPAAPPVPRLEFKAALLLGLFAALLAGSVLYLMYARGAFDAVQRLVLVADDAEGVMVGMDMTFAGFPIGRVRRIELSPEGNARIVIDVPRRDAHWLRTSSVFTLVRSVVGGTAIRAYSGVMADPPLPDGAERRVLAGDATAEIPRLVSDARALVGNLTALTASDSALGGSLANVQSVTERLKGRQGALGVLLGNEEDARKVITTLERTNTLLARLDGLTTQVSGTVTRADRQLLAEGGVLPETRAAIVQLNGLLADARGTLKKVDGVLAEAQVIATNTKVATTDLGALRAEVDASVRKVEQLVDEINRKWPFARETELKLK